MALIRKAAAGSDSFGHIWPEDDSVVEINDPEQIAALMAIVDAGFSEVPPTGKKAAEPEAEPEPEGDGGEQAGFSDVDPKTEDAEAPKPAAKKTASRKTTASKPE